VKRYLRNIVVHKSPIRDLLHLAEKRPDGLGIYGQPQYSLPPDMRSSLLLNRACKPGGCLAGVLQ